MDLATTLWDIKEEVWRYLRGKTEESAESILERVHDEIVESRLLRDYI